jgi:hypothetical protein
MKKSRSWMFLGGDVDGAEVEKVGVRVVAVDFENFRDESSAGPSLDVDYHVERIGDVRLNRTVRQLDAALLSALWSARGSDDSERHHLSDLSAHRKRGRTIPRESRGVKPAIYASQRFKSHFSAFTGIIGKIVASLPDPQSSPENAMEFLRATKNRFGRHIGQLQTGGHVKMSARMLLELLAGTKTLKEFGGIQHLDTGVPRDWPA